MRHRKTFRASQFAARRVAIAAIVGVAVLVPAPALAQKITNAVAVFSGLDKITGRIISFDVYVDETVQFGALQVTPRVCYTRPVTEKPQTTTFVEIDEITLENKVRRIFTGWMFAASPGLHAVEHPVYDVWLTNCKATSDVPPPAGTAAAEVAAQAAAQAAEAEKTAPDEQPANGETGSTATTTVADEPLPANVPRPKPVL